jgi:hypothetical protein
MRVPLVRLEMKDIFKSFKVDLRDFYKNRVYVQHYLHIQPTEIDTLCFYEYQWMIKDLVELLKEQNGEGKKDNPYNTDEYMDKMKNQANSYTKGFGNMNKMPNMGSFKMPKF